MRTFQRILKRLKLKRKNVKTCSTDIASAVLTELEGSGSLLGYSSVHQRLRSRGIVTDRESVRICMKVLDPAGVSLRKQHKLARRSYCNKGPNYLWHIDGMMETINLSPLVCAFMEQLMDLVEKSCG